MIAQFSVLCLWKGYRHCRRCIGLIRTLKLISKGTSVRLLLNIKCYFGICLMLKVKKEKIRKPEKGGAGGKAEQVQSGQFSIAPFQCISSMLSRMSHHILLTKKPLKKPPKNKKPKPLWHSYCNFLCLISSFSSTWELFKIFDWFCALQIFASNYIHSVLSQVFSLPELCGYSIFFVSWHGFV